MDILPSATPSSPADGRPASAAATAEEIAAADAAALAAARSGGFSIPLQPLQLSDPLRWLALGWRDFRRCPGIGLFYGVVFVVMGWAIARVFEQAPAYTLALSGGFLLVGPFLALGIYRVSQKLEQGHAPEFLDSLLAWRPKMGQLGIFGFVLLVLEMLWARATLVIFAVTFDGMPDFKGSLLALLDPENISFIVAWAALGAVFATLIFAFTVVSMPMILDKQTDAITSALTSVRLFFTQTPVLVFWGLLIAVITFAAMLPAFLGLVVAGPVLGHATWHAYRAAIGR